MLCVMSFWRRLRMSSYEMWMGGCPIHPPMRDDRKECGIHGGDHGMAIPVQALRHYIFPETLQVMTLGEVQDTRIAWVCATGVANIFWGISSWLDVDPDGTMPDDRLEDHIGELAPGEQIMVKLGLRRYRAARARLADLRATGPWSIHPNDWRCPTCGSGMMLSSAGGQHTWSHTCAGRSVSSG